MFTCVFWFNCELVVHPSLGPTLGPAILRQSPKEEKNSPKWSKFGVVIGYPNMATNMPYFPANLDVPVKYRKIHVFF